MSRKMRIWRQHQAAIKSRNKKGRVRWAQLYAAQRRAYNVAFNKEKIEAERRVYWENRIALFFQTARDAMEEAKKLLGETTAELVAMYPELLKAEMEAAKAGDKVSRRYLLKLLESAGVDAIQKSANGTSGKNSKVMDSLKNLEKLSGDQGDHSVANGVAANTQR